MIQNIQYIINSPLKKMFLTISYVWLTGLKNRLFPFNVGGYKQTS